MCQNNGAGAQPSNPFLRAHMPYSIDPLSIQFTETRHGVNATARILFDGRKVGTIHDQYGCMGTGIIRSSARAPESRQGVHTRRVCFMRRDRSLTVSPYCDLPVRVLPRMADLSG
jgi:hypothetical protein